MPAPRSVTSVLLRDWETFLYIPQGRPCGRPSSAGRTNRSTTASWTKRFGKAATPSGDSPSSITSAPTPELVSDEPSIGAQSVADPNEAAVAAGLARRDQRAARRHGFIFLPIQVVFASVWLAWTLSPERRVPVAFLWLWAAIWIVLVGVAPFLIWRRIRMARHAAEANDQVADQANDLPG